jgi:hypothetical protein
MQWKRVMDWWIGKKILFTWLIWKRWKKGLNDIERKLRKLLDGEKVSGVRKKFRWHDPLYVGSAFKKELEGRLALKKKWGRRRPAKGRKERERKLTLNIFGKNIVRDF